MNLLLLLSAFLSAMTGAITGVRPPEARLHQVVAQAVVAQADPERVVQASASRMVQALPSRVVAAATCAPRRFAMFAAIPLYAFRRRE